MNYYNEIKQELLNNEINRRIKNYSINRSDLNAYFNVGKILSEAGKHYGENVIKDYSRKLQIELGKSYSVRLLYKMLKFYNFISNKKMPTFSAQLSWSHYDEILKFNNINKIVYYINICEKYNLSVRALRNRIKNNEFERLPEETKNKMINKDQIELKELIKNPIIIRKKINYDIISEKVLQRLIFDDIESFMKELGNSFCFIGSEYKI